MGFVDDWRITDSYTTCAGWLYFFFLGAGGSGMPYFSLLSAALSLYFNYWPESKNILNHVSVSAGCSVVTTNLRLLPLQLFQLCFAHFRTTENLQVFLSKKKKTNILFNKPLGFFVTIRGTMITVCSFTLWRSESCWCRIRASLFGNCLLHSKQANLDQSVILAWHTSALSISAPASSGSLSPL